MGRKPRADWQGAWHHVMNRGVARRAMFEGRRDVRVFVAAVARAVRREQLQVHSWCVLATHYHLLVRSPNGELSAAMQRVQNDYVRYFNRDRRRDGSLVRGRFCSKLVESDVYRGILVRYIDANPVRARLCEDARDYPWCSARQYARRRGPRWLTRDWVESSVAATEGLRAYRPDDYPKPLDRAASDRLASFVERRIEATEGCDELDSLRTMGAGRVGEWLRERAVLADGEVASPPCLTDASVGEGVDRMAAIEGDWRIHSRRTVADGWQVMRAGLLRDTANASFVAIGRQLRVSAVHARRLWERHRRLLKDDDAYVARLATAVRQMIDNQFASWGVG